MLPLNNMVRRNSPYLTGLLLWLSLAGLSFGLLLSQVTAPWLLLLLAALNIAAFCLYGLDKLLATQQAPRVPEYVLYFAAFAGGAIGALGAMYLFRHKTSKVSFQFALAIIILLEIVLFIALLKPSLSDDLFSGL